MVKMIKIDVRVTKETASAQDEEGIPLLTVKKSVNEYGKGSVIYLPKAWTNASVIVVKLPDVIDNTLK